MCKEQSECAYRKYYYNGDILAGYKLVITDEEGQTSLHIVIFMYDENGDAFGFNYNGNDYYYVRNAQNDVVFITDSANNGVVMYQYDAWGNITACYDTSDDGMLSIINPYTYRGYYYEIETATCFLKSRYYNPQLCRFISADSVDVLDEDQDSVLENNLFAYCLNNPINMVDDDGELASRIIGGIVGGATGVVLGIILANHLGLTGWKKAALIAAVGIGGAALGAFLGPYVAKLGGKIASVSKSMASSFKATVQSTRTAIKHSKAVTKLINNAGKLKRSKTVMRHLSSRPYTNSTLTIQNIMRAGKPMADSSLKNGLKWVVNGSYNGSFGVWELVVDTTTNTIVHFLFRSK